MANRNIFQPTTQFTLMPPVIKNLLILNGLFFLAKYVAVVGHNILLAEILNSMALYAPATKGIGYTIFGSKAQIIGFMPWQIISYSFLHGSLGHLFFNMFALWMFGMELENTWGS